MRHIISGLWLRSGTTAFGTRLFGLRNCETSPTRWAKSATILPGSKNEAKSWKSIQKKTRGFYGKHYGKHINSSLPSASKQHQVHQSQAHHLHPARCHHRLQPIQPTPEKNQRPHQSFGAKFSHVFLHSADFRARPAHCCEKKNSCRCNSSLLLFYFSFPMRCSSLLGWCLQNPRCLNCILRWIKPCSAQCQNCIKKSFSAIRLSWTMFATTWTAMNVFVFVFFIWLYI